MPNRIYSDLLSLYEASHEPLAKVMNETVNGMTIHEVGQIYKMVDSDLMRIWKRIENLRKYQQ